MIQSNNKMKHWSAHDKVWILQQEPENEGYSEKLTQPGPKKKIHQHIAVADIQKNR